MLFYLLTILGYFFALLVAVTIHEFSHAYVADQLGDPTPKLSGRLTLNPLSHIDLFGTILLPFFLLLTNASFFIAWAKPVPFDPFNLKNPHRDAALISLAGPLSNLILAVIVSFFLRLVIFFHLRHSLIFIFLNPFLSSFIYINVLLAIFNLLPIHPLDGFKIVGGLLDENQAKEWYKLESYGVLFLLLLIFPFGSSAIITKIIGPVINFILSLLIPGKIL